MVRGRRKMPVSIERRPEFNLPATPKDWGAEKEASRSLETRRIPDPYWFYMLNNKLFSPFTAKPVENAIDTNSVIGQREYTAFLQAQALAMRHNSGFILWYSPEAKNKYPVPKIIVSEIATSGDTKLLFNRAIILDSNRNDCVAIAVQLDNRPFVNPEEIRENVFFFNPPEGFHWTRYLEEFIWAPDEFEQVRRGTDVEMKLKAMRQVEEILKTETRPIHVWTQMQNMGMIGQYPESCPLASRLTAVEFLLKHSLLVGEKKFVKNCGNCGATINNYISAGYKCPHCGGVYGGC